MSYPKKILHWIGGKETAGDRNRFFFKFNPANGKELGTVLRAGAEEVGQAIRASVYAFPQWSEMPVIARADLLRRAAELIRGRREEISEIVALESGKPLKIARSEIDAAAECGFFFAGEGRRYLGEVLTSAQPNRAVQLIREPVGVGALITPFNNPASGIAWKLFPALLCGNTVVIKSHEDTPYAAVWFAKIFKEAGVPAGVISVVQGLGREAGAALVADERVQFVSFTGSVNTGRSILKATAERLAKVSIEAGGKNALVVCDDADLEYAAAAASAAAFVDGGQRCAAASRIIVFDSVYGQFKKLFLAKVAGLKVGTGNGDDYGAIINEKRMRSILAAVRGAAARGAKILCGGKRLTDAAHKNGFFIAPTVLENIGLADPISCEELFGPVVNLYRVKNFDEAVALANAAPFKLTAAIHTSSIHRAQEFIRRCQAGVVRVNGPTHGSEPHLPFGGPGLSGNGWREPGTTALDFYSEWKQVSIDHSPEKI